jgi:hypothetical protein
LDSSTLIIGFVAGAMGLAYLIYGKKQARVVPLICGGGLMFLPYLIENWIVLLLVCVALLILPWVVKA